MNLVDFSNLHFRDKVNSHFIMREAVVAKEGVDKCFDWVESDRVSFLSLKNVNGNCPLLFHK